MNCKSLKGIGYYTHLCGLEKGHVGKHKCLIDGCDKTWERRPIKQVARKKPTTRALLNAGGGKKSSPALRKARNVVKHGVKGFKL